MRLFGSVQIQSLRLHEDGCLGHRPGRAADRVGTIAARSPLAPQIKWSVTAPLSVGSSFLVSASLTLYQSGTLRQRSSSLLFRSVALRRTARFRRAHCKPRVALQDNPPSFLTAVVGARRRVSGDRRSRSARSVLRPEREPGGPPGADRRPAHGHAQTRRIITKSVRPATDQSFQGRAAAPAFLRLSSGTPLPCSCGAGESPFGPCKDSLEHRAGKTRVALRSRKPIL